MIECTDKYIWYKKKNRSFAKRFFRFVIFIIILIGVFFYYKFIVSEQLFNYCINKAFSFSTECVNESVIKYGENLKYDNLIKIEKNNSGDIVLMSVNSDNVNMANKNISIKTTELLKEKMDKGVPVPLFAFSGIPFISGYGKEIYLKTINVVSVKADFESVFKSVGINQTLHSIYLNVESQIQIDIPLRAKETKCNTEVLISETVLIGKVPEIYMNGGLFTGINKSN